MLKKIVLSAFIKQEEEDTYTEKREENVFAFCIMR
jgi:hypothetical protein